MHLHATPDVIPRKLDAVELVKRARSAGMRGVLLKCHSALTSDVAWLLNKLDVGTEAFGSLVLNTSSTGGLNPQAVDVAIKLGAKEIWMPTISSAHILESEGKNPKDGITILSETGDVLPEVIKILHLIAKARIILGTGHISLEETKALTEAAVDQGVEKIMVTHPEYMKIPDKAQRELAEKGAIMEHCYYATTEIGGLLNPQQIAKQIRFVGAENCIMSTDLGQVANPYPVEGMADYIDEMLSHGITRNEIEVMTKENPAKLLGLSM